MLMSDSDDEDETAELMRELERIKKERAEQRAKEVRDRLCERIGATSRTDWCLGR